MMIYEFKIKDDYLSEVTRFDGVSGNKNVYLCNFYITCEEENTVWFAVFKKNEMVYVVPLENGACKMPYEILENTGLAYIGCYAECDGEKRFSTNWLPIEIGEGAYSDGTAPTPPDEELWETLLRNSVPIIDENGNWFTYDMQSQEYVDTGFPARGGQGPKGDKGDKGDTGEQGYTPQKGVDYFTAAEIEEICGPIDIAMRIAMYGKDITPSGDSNFIFYDLGGLAYSVKAANTNISGDIVIPYEHNGKPVVKIHDYGFCSNQNITSITLPKSITTFGAQPFYSCPNLVRAEIPDSITSITDNIFWQSPNVTVYTECGSAVSGYCKQQGFPCIYNEMTSNKVKSITTQSTDDQYPSAKAVYDAVSSVKSSIITQSAPSAIMLSDNTEYYLTDVTSLTFTYPNTTHWQTLIVLKTASSGTVSIGFPQGTRYIGDAPTFGNGETWEISIRDGVVIAGKAV